jgi:DsbC/DsbD-like thiol-disulfide interchange protein
MRDRSLFEEMMNRFFICVLGIVVLGSAAWLVSAKRGRTQSPAEDHVKLELVSEQNALVSGQDLLVGIRFILEDGWHTYWINPGDSGEAPRMEWQLPAGFQAGAIQWPYPERLTTPPFTDYGYEHEVLLMVPIRLPAKLKEGETEKIAAQVHFLICRDVCIPGKKQLGLSLPVKNRAAPSATRELFAAARARVPSPAPPNWNISVASIGDEFVLDLQIGGPPKVLQFFPLYAEQIENAAPQEVTIFPGGVRLHLKKSKHLLKPIARLQGVIVVDSEGAYSVDVPVSRSIENANAQIAD